MDEITQQNAALLEEAAAASETLGERGNDLSTMMEFFSLTSGGEDTNSEAEHSGTERRSADRPWSVPAEPTSEAKPLDESPPELDEAAPSGDLSNQALAGGSAQIWTEF